MHCSCITLTDVDEACLAEPESVTWLVGLPVPSSATERPMAEEEKAHGSNSVISAMILAKA